MQFVFSAIYIAAIVLQLLIRLPHEKKRHQLKVSKSGVTPKDKLGLVLLTLSYGVLPMMFIFTSYLNFANYEVSILGRLLGVLVQALSVFVFWRSHLDLGGNFSPLVEIQEKHQLVTQGVYGIVRHPMYASLFLWVIAQPFILPNWLAGMLNIPVFFVFYFVRGELSQDANELCNWFSRDLRGLELQ